MELTIPKLLSIPFADEGQKNDIPNIVTAPSSNLASYRDGFPAVTMVPRAAGGQPPLGQDMNGVLNEITSHTVFQNIGGQYRFDAELVAAIGGYPKGVVLQNDEGSISYISLEDNNTENFNTVEEITKWRIYNAFPATEALAGIARIATEAEVEAGVNDDTIITPAKLASALSNIKALPIGFMTMWPSNALPEKWMIRNGDILAIADFPELFAVIGTTFGGDGVTTFALPDDRGLVERGLDMGRGYDPGRVLGSEQQDEFKSHTHNASKNALTSTGGTYGISTNASTSSFQVITTTAAGGLETRMKNRAYLPIIKML